MRHPRREQGLRREVGEWLEPTLKAGDAQAVLARLRLFQQRELMRLAARDLARLASTPEIILELSNLADLCLSTVLRLCQQQMERFGRPYHQTAGGGWRATEFAVLGLGKLGGQELNYNSDVDLAFVYSEEGVAFKQHRLRSTSVAQKHEAGWPDSAIIEVHGWDRSNSGSGMRMRLRNGARTPRVSRKLYHGIAQPS